MKKKTESIIKFILGLIIVLYLPLLLLSSFADGLGGSKDVPFLKTEFSVFAMPFVILVILFNTVGRLMKKNDKSLVLFIVIFLLIALYPIIGYQIQF